MAPASPDVIRDADHEQRIVPRLPRAGHRRLKAVEVVARFEPEREHAALPARIEALEDEARMLRDRITGPDFYKEGADAIRTAMAREVALTTEIETLYARWQQLEGRV